MQMLAVGLAAPLPGQEETTASTLSVAGKCFLLLAILFFAVEALLYIVKEKADRYPDPDGAFEKVFTAEKLNVAKGAMVFVPVISIIMLFIMFRMSKLDQDIYDPLTNTINPTFADRVPNYGTIQMGYMLCVVGIYLQGLDAFDIRLESNVLGDMSNWFGQLAIYIGFGIIVYGATAMRNPDVPISMACQTLISLSLLTFALQALIKFLQMKGPELLGSAVGEIPAFNSAASKGYYFGQKPPGGETAEPDAADPSQDAEAATPAAHLSDDDETQPLLGDGEVEALNDGPQEDNSLPTDLAAYKGADLKALNPMDILFNESKLTSALTVIGLIPNFMLLAFFIHFRLREAEKFESFSASNEDFIAALELNDQAMQLGTLGIFFQVAAVLALSACNAALGTVARVIGLFMSYAAYGYMGYFAIIMKPLTAPEVLCGVGLLGFSVILQVVVFIMDEVQKRKPALKFVQVVLKNMIKTTSYASIISILMFYMHFRACMLRLDGATAIIPSWSESACFGAAGSVAIQAALVLLGLLDPFVKNLASMILFIKTIVMGIMYVSFGLIVYSCTVI